MAESVERMEAEGMTVTPWVKEMLATVARKQAPELLKEQMGNIRRRALTQGKLNVLAELIEKRGLTHGRQAH